MAYLESKGVDLNKAGECTSVVTLAKEVNAAIQLSFETGAYSAAVVTLEGSLDGIKYVSTGVTLSAEGVSSLADVTRFKFLRARVSTANGAALVSTVTIFAKV